MTGISEQKAHSIVVSPRFHRSGCSKSGGRSSHPSLTDTKFVRGLFNIEVFKLSGIDFACFEVIHLAFCGPREILAVLPQTLWRHRIQPAGVFGFVLCTVRDAFEASLFLEARLSR
jgi:hypothetical protein